MAQGMEQDVAEAILARAARAHFAACRERIPGFVSRHFGLTGSLRIHRNAVGWDLLRAPANLALALPQVLLRVSGLAARSLGAPETGARLAGVRLLRETAVAREVQWLLLTELLRMPHRAADGRVSERDGLAEAVLADPEVAALIEEAAAAAAERGRDAAFRLRLEESLAEYAGTRAAAAEITTGLLTLGAGAAIFHQATPGAIALGPALATALAQSSAVAGFPLGATLGGVWYGFFPATTSMGLIAGTTAALGAFAAIVSAFAGVVADPVQKALGLHQRRLARFIDALERQFAEADARGYVARDQYVARLMDLADILLAVVRAKG